MPSCAAGEPTSNMAIFEKAFRDRVASREIE